MINFHFLILLIKVLPPATLPKTLSVFEHFQKQAATFSAANLFQKIWDFMVRELDVSMLVEVMRKRFKMHGSQPKNQLGRCGVAQPNAVP